MTKGKSARGVIVDFDLLRIKEQMSAVPPSVDVRKRQDFIENRLRRRKRKKVPQELLDKANAEVAEATKIDVEPSLPSVEGEVAEMIEPATEKVVPKKKTVKSKQKARPKAKDK